MEDSINHPWQHYGGRTYAQHGDDLIILNIFRRLQVEKPSYLDIGAHHPLIISNTALLYKRGSRGINVEASPDMMAEFHRHRPEDINLNIGVAARSGVLKFYINDEHPGRNSFMRHALDDIGVTREMELPVTTIGEIVERYSGGIYPDLLTVDLEGSDCEVLATINYERQPPKVICVEVGDSSTHAKGLLGGLGYFPYCWAGANMMFIRSEYRDAMY